MYSLYRREYTAVRKLCLYDQCRGHGLNFVHVEICNFVIFLVSL